MRFAGFCLAPLILFAACKQNREIKVYRVAKDAAPPAPVADPHAGVPGAMPGGGMPAAAAGDPHAGLSADQLAAVGSSASPQVGDSPPAGWKKQPATAMRQLSYLVEGEGGATVDISLIILRGAAGGTLENVNRWRGQLGLPPVDEAGLKASSTSIATPSGDGVVVEIEGLAPGADPAKDGRMVGVIAESGRDGWFFKMRGNSALVSSEKERFLQWVPTVKPSGKPAAAPAPAAAETPGDLTWQVPDGWSKVAAGASMRYATFTVTGPDGSKGEMAVTHFPGDVGGDLENVNRWRNQVALSPVDAAGLGALVSRITAGPKTFSFIDITGPQTRLAAGWTRHGPDTWFFKLTGPDGLVAAEKAKFTAFLESIRFNKPE